MSIKPKSQIVRAFWAGFILHASISMFYQDWVGLDKYLSLVKKGWVDTHWSLFLVTGIIALIYYNYLLLRINQAPRGDE